MGILDSIIGSVTGGGTAGSSPMSGILSGLLGGNQGGGGGSGGMLGGGGQAAGNQGGGLQGLLSKFEGAGLGGIAQSWVGNGANHPVSPQQLQGVLGQDQVQGMANQAGMQPHDFLSQLSQHLPNAVNAMTPDGQVPADGSMSV